MTAQAGREPATGEIMQPPEIITVDEAVVACDGGNGPLGHPRVYLRMAGESQVDCPYCGRRYVLKEGAKAGAH
jgi:uncharacterized Zn-finger protein